jgi:putative ABC transport system permease protein
VSDERPPGIRRLFRIRWTLRGVRSEVRDEIRFHLESRAAELVARGMSPKAAHEQAYREYGDIEQSQRELVRVDRRRLTSERREEMLMSVIQDLRYAARGLARRPALTAVTTFALTVGIAANAVMFGVVDQLLLRPPPGVVAPDGVRRIYFQEMRDGTPQPSSVTSYPAIVSLRENVGGMSDVAGYFHTNFTLGHGADARSVEAELVSGNYFRLLGVRPQLGRTFAPDEDVPPQGALVAVVGDGFWRNGLGARPDVVGLRLELNSKVFTIVGVAPAGLSDLDRQKVDFWVPIASVAADVISDDWYRAPNSWWVQAIARLRPEVRPDLVTEQATTAYRHEVRSWVSKGRDSMSTVVLAPLVGGRNPGGMSAEAKVSLWLMGVSAIVLLIACANVANLLIARTMQRRREIAVRLALGVSRGRLLRQLLTEAALLAAIAAAVALVVAHWGGQLVQHVLLPGIAWSDSVVDLRVLAFTLAVTVTCILLAGLAPSVHGVHTTVSDALKASSRQVAGGRGLLRNSLLVVQAALSVVLLVGAGLFVKSLRNVTGRDVGITLDKVMLVSMNLSRAGFAPSQIEQIFTTGAERVRAIPGVQQAALVASSVPMRSGTAVSLYVPGVEKRSEIPGGGPYSSVVSADFFAVTGASLRAGRMFAPAEERSPSRVMLVNEVVAKAFWPGKSPIGACVRLARDSTCTQVIGVVQNIMLFSMVRDDRAMIYVPPGHPAFAAARQPQALLVRTSRDPSTVAPLVRAELQRLSPNMPFVQVKPFIDLVAPQLRPWRLGATMFTLFGAMALVIAAVGLYSVMAYWVSQRTHEIGVRMALGARRADVVRLVVSQASRPIATGLLLGGAAAALSSRWVGDMLYETSARDPWVYGTAAVVLAIAALAASVVPARRSAAVDPASALRAD